MIERPFVSLRPGESVLPWLDQELSAAVRNIAVGGDLGMERTGDSVLIYTTNSGGEWPGLITASSL